jgi:phenylpyruvate tautomerase PptA (4-oxalocrotonate tautomerase family)
MPILVCECAKLLDPSTRESVAGAITSAVHDVIGSDLELISVILRQPDPDQIWTAGRPSGDALILCYIRAGRPQALKSELAMRVSAAWHETVGTDEASIEVAVFETPASQTARGGRRLPEPPHSIALAAQ